MKDPGLVALSAVNGALLGVFGLVFTPLYVGTFPVPLGALVSALVLPWLVGAAGEIEARPEIAGTPILTWLLAVGVLGLTGPGGDVLLPATWQSLVLVVAGLGAGLLTLRRVIEEGTSVRRHQ